MGIRAWTRPVGDGLDAQVTLESTGSGGEARYQVEFPFVVTERAADDILITGEGRIEDHHLRSASGLPVSDLVVTIPGGFDVERLIVRSRPERVVIHLPSDDLLHLAARVIDGDEAAAEDLIDRFASPVQIPLICGSFLDLGQTIRLIEALVRRDRHVQSMVHSYRYAIVRSAVVSRAGLHVGTYRELRELVDGLDAIPQIGAVSLVDALGDVIETVHDTPADTERMLGALGVDFDTLDEGTDALFTTCFLAHLACTEGVEAAESYELPSKFPPRGYYERRKRAVLRAAYGERGRAWRRLLNAARRESEREVGKVLAHTLYWTGEESRTDSRMQELLLRGAEIAASHAGLRTIEYRARYERLIAAGHRLRGTHCWDPSIANFEAARRLAMDFHVLDEWEPILSKGLVQSRQLSQRGDHERAIDVLDETIDDFLSAEPPKSVANRSVRHARAQKCEIESLLHRSDDPGRARTLLEEARAHYGAIGFDRSRDRIERILESLPTMPAPAGPPDTRVDAVERPQQVVEEPPLEAAPEPPMDASAQMARPAELGDDWLESIEYPDEDEVDEDYDEKFDDPYAF